MSYQANVVSHHPRNRHAGFFSARSGIGKYNKISGYFLLSSCHNTKFNLRDKNITTHTRFKFHIQKLMKRNSVLCCFSLYRATQKETKERGRHVRMGVYRVV